MILIIDNYDSFTYNLVHLVRRAAPGTALVVLRNDETTVSEIGRLQPRAIVISPGPGRPEDAGVSVDVIRAYHDRWPILGVCLGHQCIAAAFGGRVRAARQLRHGKTSPISHDGRGLFAGVPDPFVAARYHSLAIDETALPPELTVVARSMDNEIMAVRHAMALLHGIQFHPESFMTGCGHVIMANFVRLAFPEDGHPPSAGDRSSESSLLRIAPLQPAAAPGDGDGVFSVLPVS